MKVLALGVMQFASVLIFFVANVAAAWAAPLSSDIATGGEWRSYNKTVDGQAILGARASNVCHALGSGS